MILSYPGVFVERFLVPFEIGSFCSYFCLSVFNPFLVIEVLKLLLAIVKIYLCRKLSQD